MYRKTYDSYSNRWNKKHRAELNKERRMRRRIRKQHIKNLEAQVKLVPKLKDKANKLQNELTNFRNRIANVSKLKKQISQLKFKVQFLNQFKTSITKDYILMKVSNNKKNNKISFLKNELNQVDTLKSQNKSLVSRCASAASIIKASKSKSADTMSKNKSFLIGKSRKGLFGKWL